MPVDVAYFLEVDYLDRNRDVAYAKRLMASLPHLDKCFENVNS